MPEQKYYTEPSLNKGYVYTDLSREKIQIVADDMNYISTLSARRRENLKNISLKSVYTERKGSDRMRLGVGFKRVLKDTMARAWTLLYEPTLFSLFETGGVSETAQQGTLDTQVIENRAKAEQHINLNVRNIVVNIPKDVTITNELGTIEVENRAKFARTMSELNRVLDAFCLKQLTHWEKYTSVGVLKNALLEALEDLFQINEYEGIKVILYNENQPKFTAVIQDALKEYQHTLTLRKAAQRDLISYDWEVPVDRVYNEDANVIVPEVVNHALEPFIRVKSPSDPEKHFEDFLEQNKAYIDWWYKNGDSGKMNYAVPYINIDGDRALFYVDFVIRMKNGQIFLFDTKSIGSDKNGPNKHNALFDYMESPENADKYLKGGIIIEEFGVWRYSPLKIENTTDLTGWSAFFPDQIK